MLHLRLLHAALILDTTFFHVILQSRGCLALKLPEGAFMECGRIILDAVLTADGIGPPAVFLSITLCTCRTSLSRLYHLERPCGACQLTPQPMRILQPPRRSSERLCHTERALLPALLAHPGRPSPRLAVRHLISGICIGSSQSSLPSGKLPF